LTRSWRSGPLGVPAFRLLTVGQFSSNVGDYCYAVALPWLVLSDHGSTILLGALLVCYGIPRTVLIPVGGVLTDKMSPRTVMLAADLSRCVLVAVFAVLAAHHVVSLAALGPLAALIGAGEGLFIPASYSIVPSLLDEKMLLPGNALYQVGQQAGSLIGPAIGGLLVAGFGSSVALGVDALSFAVSALSLARISVRPAGAAATADPADADAPAPGPARGVLAFLRGSPSLQVLLLIIIAANLTFGGLTEVALPALAHERWAASGYGALLAFFAAGSIAGNLATTRAGGARRPMIASGCAFLIAAAAMAAVPFLGGLAGAAAALLVLGACTGFGNTRLMPSVQTMVPPHMIGRLMSLVMLCSMGAFPLSAAVAGVLVRHIGPVAFFPISGAFFGAVMLFAMALRTFRDFGALQTAPAAPASEGY
jgi:MFS family permease